MVFYGMYGMVWIGTRWDAMEWNSKLRHTIGNGKVLYGIVWYGMAWYEVVLDGMLWNGIASYVTP